MDSELVRLTKAESRILTAGYDAACRSREGWIEVEKAVEQIIAARVAEAKGLAFLEGVQSGLRSVKEGLG